MADEPNSESSQQLMRSIDDWDDRHWDIPVIPTAEARWQVLPEADVRYFGRGAPLNEQDWPIGVS